MATPRTSPARALPYETPGALPAGAGRRPGEREHDEGSTMTGNTATGNTATGAGGRRGAPPRVALVGDRSPSVRAHVRIPKILDALRDRHGLTVDAYWIPTPEARDLEGFDGVWLLPGSPYESEAGAVNAARTAREHRIPLLGTCGGFQHILLEYARDVCELPGVAHGENTPGAAEQLIEQLACSLAGHQGTVRLSPHSLAERLIGAEKTVEAYHCSFGLNPAYADALTAAGLRFTGHDEDGAVRVAELPGHPFFLATLFQPELAERPPHPIIRGFAAAVLEHARAKDATAP
ncbi:gamma-glutamyl-gamma-aminobutyrate hydrolase family protein [Thermopolyspora sp. NPDC052614]|uniref:CTP synthase C-terminal region-related (seleno)protein n=1 Tax=Thermopolyspora sp. NPDC052614 TaxID=3155682 RepID=UPI003423C2EA